MGCAALFVLNSKLNKGDCLAIPQYEISSGVGRRRGLVVELRTPEREVGGLILTQIAVLCP